MNKALSSNSVELQGFILTREWRDAQAGAELSIWARTPQGPLKMLLTVQQPVLFVSRDEIGKSGVVLAANWQRKPLTLKTLDGEWIDAIYFRRQRDLLDCRDMLKSAGVEVFEGEVPAAERFLMERFVRGGFVARGNLIQRNGYLEMINPSIKADSFKAKITSLSIDIETSPEAKNLYSIAASDGQNQRVFMLDEEATAIPDALILFYHTETELLKAFFDWTAEVDPDVLIGWNVIGFDLEKIQDYCNRLRIPFALGRGGSNAVVLQPRNNMEQKLARVPGRVVLDGIETLRAAFYQFESFALDSVANELLGRGKLIESTVSDIKTAEIDRQFKEDKHSLAKYNLEDCRLVNEIFDKTSLLEFAVERSRITGLALGRHGGSVAAFDHLYLPRLHRAGYVAPSIGARTFTTMSPGGYVMDSMPGLYKDVLLLDFKSLYPSIIRTFKIDPLGLAQPGDKPVPGFLNATFAREGGLLPAIIDELWDRRDQAKRTDNKPLSQAVKIIMNSFYGVLGTSSCRFYDPRLASSITMRGHEIIQASRTFIEQAGYTVIYGDTDSLFISCGDERGRNRSPIELGRVLAKSMNDYWNKRIRDEYDLHSYLEVEFESHFSRFFMPTIRGSETGSKKRYAGMIVSNSVAQIVFKGLEAVRSDWTVFAKEFQTGLYEKIFHEQPFEAFIKQAVARLYSGTVDNKLVYAKRLRQSVGDYKKNVPPHVKAAKLLDKPGNRIRYVITVNGPEPVERLRSPINYDHYQEKQLKPIADAIIPLLGKRFDDIAAAQISLFS